jgi:hypothetical protein
VRTGREARRGEVPETVKEGALAISLSFLGPQYPDDLAGLTSVGGEAGQRLETWVGLPFDGASRSLRVSVCPARPQEQRESRSAVRRRQLVGFPKGFMASPRGAAPSIGIAWPCPREESSEDG